jgi:carbon-monoxide dehydrogenase iron sulfur subunit
MKTVFIHPERCIGCKQCEVACAVEHSDSKSLFWSVFESPAPQARIHAEAGLWINTSYPNKCRHCNPAPCLACCPTAAIYRNKTFPDIVLIEARKCIACGMCAMVCPFDAITYHTSAAVPEKKVVAVKCDQCLERQSCGQAPACVEACKVNALEFGEVNTLIRAGRVHYAQSVWSSPGQGAEGPQLPPLVKSWRDWGMAVSQLNEGLNEEMSEGKKGA